MVLEAKDQYDLLLEKMGIAGGASSKATKLKAPMPGKGSREIMVETGKTVAKGEGLLILGGHEDGEHAQGRTRRNGN